MVFLYNNSVNNKATNCKYLNNQLKIDSNFTDYSGGYSGVIKEEDESGNIVDINVNFYFMQENDKIVFLSFGKINKYKLIGNKIFSADNEEKRSIGEFITKDDIQGFLYTDNQNNKYFLKKNLSKELSEEEINKNKEWEDFFKTLKSIINGKNINAMAELINNPIFDRRTVSWDNPVKITNKKDIEKLAEEIVNSQYYSDDFIDFGEAEDYFSGCYRYDLDSMFLYFKKINGKIKLVTITNVFG